MNKAFKTVFAVFVLVGLLIANIGMVDAAVLTTYRPLGNTYAIKPTYSWAMVGATPTYKLQVYDIAAAIYKVNMVINKSACKTATNRCSTMPNVVLTINKTYRWRAAAGSGAFSVWKTFKVLAGFNSQFTANSAGWLVRPGGTWPVSGGTLHTTGVTNKWSSITYGNVNFNNFTYSARMKRVGASGGASGFWLRGPATFTTDINAVKNGYLFLYSQKGCFSVWKHVNGAVVQIKGWTLSPSIIKNNWNTLKVTADGPALRFYINNHLVWSGSNSSFTTGNVALTMYRTTAEQFSVDWAALGMSELYKAAALGESDVIEQGQVEIAPDASQPYGPEQAPVVP